MSTIHSTDALFDYSNPLAMLPPEAFLGSLLWFSISQADVNLAAARDDLVVRGLSTDAMRKILRPVDAFRKSTREMAHKFKVVDGVRSELLVRPVGEDGEQCHRHLILERAVVDAGKKRRVFYEKVGEVIFTRGVKKDGAYSGYGVTSHRTTDGLTSPLRPDEEKWLTDSLAGFQDRFDHLLHYMDSHAVRSFVRDFIENLNGTCVKETGGLYFVAQKHVEQIKLLGEWVRAVGSSFHYLPLLNLSEQRQMIMDAFEDETIAEVERLMAEVAAILKEPGRQIEGKTFDNYGLRAAELTAKVKEYNNLLGERSTRATIEINTYTQQIMTLAGRIRDAAPTPTTRVQVNAA